MSQESKILEFVTSNSSLCFLVQRLDSFYIAYLFDNRLVDRTIPLSKSFKKKSRAHVGVLCAERKETTGWRVTNVRVSKEHRRKGIATILNSVASMCCSFISHDDTRTYACDRVLENLQSLFATDTRRLREFFDGIDAWKRNLEEFASSVEDQSESVRDVIVDAVLRGFAVVDMSER